MTVCGIAERRPIANATRRRETYLSPNERHCLINAMPEDIKPMARAMTLLPFRPSVFANLTVADFDERQSTLHVEKD